MTTREDFEKLVEQQLINAWHDGSSEYGNNFDFSAAQNEIVAACAAHYEAELLKRDTLIAEKDKALQFYADGKHISQYEKYSEIPDQSPANHWRYDNAEIEDGSIATEALSLTHDSVRLVDSGAYIYYVMTAIDWQEKVSLEPPSENSVKSGRVINVEKLYTIVEGEVG